MKYVLDEDIMRSNFFVGNSFRHANGNCFRLFPFNTTNSEVKSLKNALGMWICCLKGKKVECNNFDEVLEKLYSEANVDADPKEKFEEIVASLFWDDEKKLKPNSIVTMQFVETDNKIEERIALYLYSVLGNPDTQKLIIHKAESASQNHANVLEKVISDVLVKNTSDLEVSDKVFQTIASSPAGVFSDDLTYIVENPTRTKEYLLQLLEFYYFFYTAQTTLLLEQFENGSRQEIVPLYFSLDWEKTSKARECYTRGWNILQRAIQNQFCHAITLEILNQNTLAKKYDYISLKEYCNEHPDELDEMCNTISKLITIYRDAIIGMSSNTEKAEFDTVRKEESYGPVFAEIHYLFDSIKNQFDNSVRGGANKRYIDYFTSFCRENFLKHRGQSGLMLNISEELLIFLTRLAIKDQDQMSLNEVFIQFEKRGVFLDRISKEEVVKFYSKLNLIDKKSDSGDAQYVKRIL